MNTQHIGADRSQHRCFPSVTNGQAKNAAKNIIFAIVTILAIGVLIAGCLAMAQISIFSGIGFQNAPFLIFGGGIATVLAIGAKVVDYYRNKPFEEHRPDVQIDNVGKPNVEIPGKNKLSKPKLVNENTGPITQITKVVLSKNITKELGYKDQIQDVEIKDGPITQVPKFVLSVCIIKKLGYKDQIQLYRTCKKMKAALEYHWKELCGKKWPEQPKSEKDSWCQHYGWISGKQLALAAKLNRIRCESTIDGKELSFSHRRFAYKCLEGFEIVQDKIILAYDEKGFKVWDLKTKRLTTVGEKIEKKKIFGHEFRIAGNIILEGNEWFKRLQVIDALTYKKIRTIELEKGSLSSILWQFIENHIFICHEDDDNRLRTINLTTGLYEKVFEGHTDRVTCLQIVKDRIITGSFDKTVKLWDRQTGECLNTFIGHTKRISCLQVVEKQLFTCSWDKKVKIWDLNSGDCLKTLEGHSVEITSLHVTIKHIITGSDDGIIKVWDRKTGACIKTLHCQRAPKSVKVLGESIIVASRYEDEIQIWDRKTGECVGSLAGHKKGTNRLELTTGKIRLELTTGKIISSSIYDPIVKVWSLR